MGEELRSDLADIDASAKPPIKGVEIAKIDGLRMRALAVSPKLRIKSAYGSREPHLNHGPMNASPGNKVNSILRRFEIPGAIQGYFVGSGRILASTAATLGDCGWILGG